MNARSISKLALGSLFLVSALALATAAPDETETSYSERPRRVRLAEVTAVSAERTVRFSGVTRAARRAELAFSVGARMVARPVEVGQELAAGQSIARLDARELRHAVAGAEAGLADVEARFARIESERRRVDQLFAAAAATAEELEQVTAGADALAAARDAAEARLRDARRLLGEADLGAPFAGVVTEVHFEPGEFVPAGRPVVVLAGGDALEVEMRLPESVITQIEPGDRVRIELPMAGLVTGGTLEHVGLAAGSSAGLYPALVKLDPDGASLPGMTAEVEFELGGRNALAVPLAAVLNPGGSRPRVFRLDGDIVEPVDVEVLKLAGDRIAVRADLSAGDEVVVTGHTSLVAGDRVEVLQ